MHLQSLSHTGTLTTVGGGLHTCGHNEAHTDAGTLCGHAHTHLQLELLLLQRLDLLLNVCLLRLQLQMHAAHLRDRTRCSCCHATNMSILLLLNHNRVVVAMVVREGECTLLIVPTAYNPRPVSYTHLTLPTIYSV